MNVTRHQQRRHWSLRIKAMIFGGPQGPPEFESAARSIAGARLHNEDRCYCSDQNACYVVADGMAGHTGGALASQIAIETIPDVIRTQSRSRSKAARDPRHALRTSIQAACDEMARIAAVHRNYRRMGCTLAVATVRQDTMYFAHVGDCRIYLQRDGRLQPLTRDETFVQHLVDTRILRPSQARRHRMRHIVTNSVSAKGLQRRPQIAQIPLRPQDCVLMTTDGLTETMVDGEIETLLREDGTTDQAVARLIDAASRTGAPDNVSCLAFRRRVDDQTANGTGSR